MYIHFALISSSFQEGNSGLIGFMDLWIISVGISSAGV